MRTVARVPVSQKEKKILGKILQTLLQAGPLPENSLFRYAQENIDEFCDSRTNIRARFPNLRVLEIRQIASKLQGQQTGLPFCFLPALH